MIALVTGATGFLGTHLRIAAIEAGIDPIIATFRLSELSAMADAMRTWQPEIVFHCAAMTNVDECEKNPRLAMETNCIGTRDLVRHLPKDCRFIYISTDMVYSGCKSPHREFSISESPMNVYGLTKYMGEFEASKAPNHLILRTNFYGMGAGPTSLVHNMLELFKRDGITHLFYDSYFNPLHIKTLSKLIVTAAVLLRHKTGIYNLGSIGGMSKLQFAVRLSEILDVPIHQARPVPMATFGSLERAQRPNDTRMDISRFEQTFGLVLPRMDTDMLHLKDE